MRIPLSKTKLQPQLGRILPQEEVAFVCDPVVVQEEATVDCDPAVATEEAVIDCDPGVKNDEESSEDNIIIPRHYRSQAARGCTSPSRRIVTEDSDSFERTDVLDRPSSNSRRLWQKIVQPPIPVPPAQHSVRH